MPSTITVMNTDDTGAGSLRAAIEQANVDAAQDTITFAPSVTGTIVLANSLPDLAASMNIVGPGPSALTVARNGAGGTPLFGIFTVSAGAQVAISGLTITGGNATAFGGGIENSGTLSLVNAVISGNSAGTFPTDYVSSAGNGGGIDNSGTLSITDSTISGNSAYGGLNGLPGLDETPGQGGGINNTGNMSVTNSTVNGNSASLGGGIDNFGALAVVCSTVSGDTALGYFGKYMNEGFPQGGGIDNSGTLSVTYSTISGNIAVEGGGIANSAKASIFDTIVAGNIRDSVNGDANDIDGDVTGSNNLIGPGGSGGLIGGQDGNIVLTSDTGLGLSSLGNYGGPTQTMALLPGSPAIDAGIAVSGVTTDQRGITRPQGSAPDIGAFESRGFVLAVVSGDDQSTPSGLAFRAPLVVSVVSPFGEPVAGGLVTFTAPATGAAAEIVGTPAIVGSNGQASATASANAFAGNYSVTVGTAGAGTVAFSLTNSEDPTITVMNTDDSGAGSLRAAIEQADLDAAQDTITFAPSVIGTISLLSALPDLSAGMSIVGPGPSALSVARSSADGLGIFSIFTVSAGAQVAISGLTITGGVALDGGGIDNLGTLSISNDVVSGNSAGTTSYVESAGMGGGIDNSGTLSITDSTISNNTATAGAAQSGSGIPGQGGGISNTGTMSVTDSTFSGNSATFGGGIDNSSIALITCSTFYGNAALDYAVLTGTAPGQGGGINNSGTISVTYSTFSANSASLGGGIDNSKAVSMVDTIAAGNTASESNAPSDIAGGVTGSYNLIGPGGSGGLVDGQDGNILLTSLTGLGLSPLGNYGGPTQTVALLPGSPALGAGITVSAVTTDQRGIARPQGNAPDIGAFESRGFVFTIVSGEGQLTPISSAFPAPLVVAVVSRFGEPVAGGLVTFTAPATGAAAEFVGTPALVNSDGQASVTASANGFAGNYSVTVAAAGAGTVTFSLTNVAAPTVISLKRFGFHDQPTLLVLTFSEPMDATQAENRANYRLVRVRPWRQPSAKYGHAIPIRYARYDAAAQTVTIRPIRRLPLRRTFMLTVVGTSPGGLTNTSGIFLDGAGTGQPGSDYTAIVNRKSLAGEVGRHKATR